MKGDAVYETSGSYSNSTGAWLGAYSYFPDTGGPFFIRGGYYIDSNSGGFCFGIANGHASSHGSFRVLLAF